MATNAKFQLNISKIMPPRPKQQWDMGGNTAKVCHYVVVLLWKETTEKPQNRLSCLEL